MSNSVEELFGTPIPKKVWHYTSVHALEGILTSGGIWATDARFTNDKTEFIHARDIVSSLIRSMESTGTLGRFSAADLQHMLDQVFDEGVLSPERRQIFLVCFTLARDFLPQWSLYADRGAGISIAFDLRHIRPPENSGLAVTFAPCQYLNNDKEQIVRSALADFMKAVSLIDKRTGDRGWVRREIETWNMIDRVFGQQFDRTEFERVAGEKMKQLLLDAWQRTVYNLLRVASHCKHESFIAEQEWRLALPRATDRPSYAEPICFRGLKPYIKSDLFSPLRLPITEVVLGPLCSEVGRIDGLIRQAGYDCPVTRSGVPLRDSADF